MYLGYLGVVVVFMCVQVLNAQRFSSGDGALCTTPNNKPGICKLFDRCEVDLDVLYAEGEPKICAYSNGDVIICCPKTSTRFVGSKAAQKCEEYKNIRCPPENTRPIQTVYGGQDVESIQEFPHQVHLGYNSETNPNFKCGGSLISDQWILTAGHCFGRETPLVADMGFLNQQNKNQYGTHQRIRIVQSVRHPNKTFTNYNDIALLRLEKRVKMSPSVVPACLHDSHEIPVRQAVATGWGKTESSDKSDILQKVVLRFVDHNSCSQKYGGERRLPQGIHAQTQICAGNDNKDTCGGDSGGPFQIGHPNACSHSIIGVTSFGKLCGNDNPGVYTRVSHYVPWIESVVWP